MIAIISRLYKK